MRAFKCKHCGWEKELNVWQQINRMHLFGKYIYMRCPNCGKRSWHKKV